MMVHPQKVDRYEIQSLLGEGGMAFVYKAYDPQFNRPVAIKVLKKRYANNDEYHKRFKNEAKAAGNVSDHQNIATIYDAGNADGKPFITMEYAGQMTLEERLGRSPKLSTKKILAIAIKVAEAIDHAHRKGIVHRDIKPSNIICGETDDDIRVTDFGIASILSIENETNDDKIIAGSPRYMSPEQITGDTLDGRSDLFSIGVVLYKLFSGTFPFQSKNNDYDELSKKICHSEHKPLQPSKKLPNGIITIINKCLAKSPSQRYDSASQLVEILKDALSNINPSLNFMWFTWKWAATMAVIMTLATSLGIYIIYDKQSQSMQDLTVEYGTAFGRFIAHKSTEPLLLIEQEGTIQLSSLIEQVKTQQTFNEIIVTDHQNVVQGSTRPNLLNTFYKTPVDSKTIKTDGKVTIYQRRNKNNTILFNLKIPITIQDKRIGTVYLGISQEKAHQALDLTLTTLLLFMAITLATAIAVILLLVHTLRRPLTILNRGLEELKNLRLDYRISPNTRLNDIFKEVFKHFNAMAEAIDQQKNEMLKQPSMSAENVSAKDSFIKEPLIEKPFIEAPPASNTPSNDDTQLIYNPERTRILEKKIPNPIKEPLIEKPLIEAPPVNNTPSNDDTQLIHNPERTRILEKKTPNPIKEHCKKELAEEDHSNA